MKEPILPFFNNICLLQMKSIAKRSPSAFRQHEHYIVRSILFIDSSNKLFSPFHPIEITFRSAGMSRSPRQTSLQQDFHISNSPFLFLLIHEKKRLRMHHNNVETTYSRWTDNRNTTRCVITVSHFPRYIPCISTILFIISVYVLYVHISASNTCATLMHVCRDTEYALACHLVVTCFKSMTPFSLLRQKSVL